MVRLQKFTYLLDRLDLSNVLHLVWSKCVSVTHLKIRLISISGALRDQKKKLQRKTTIQGDYHCLRMSSVDASKTQQNPCNGISNRRAENHTTQRGDKLLLFSSYKQPAALNAQLPENFKEKSRWLSKYHRQNKSCAMAEQTLANQGMLHSSTHFPHSASVHADLLWHRRVEQLNVKTADSSQQFKIPCARPRDLLERETISSVKSSSKRLAVSRAVATKPS